MTQADGVGGTLERLTSGFALLEAPRPDAEGGVYFSDLFGGVFRIDRTGSVGTTVPKRRQVGGIALHADGGVIVTGRTVCHVRDGAARELLAVEGIVFNDLCTDPLGQLWVGGSREAPGDGSPGRRLGFLYRIALDGSVEVISAGLGIPNGMGFDPAGRVLYVVDSSVRKVLQIDTTAAEPTLAVHVDLSGDGDEDFGFPPRQPTPDGLAVDALGGVWVAVLNRGTVERFDVDGSHRVMLDIGTPLVTSLAFGGPDLTHLYITVGGWQQDGSERCSGSQRTTMVFRTRLRVCDGARGRGSGARGGRRLQREHGNGRARSLLRHGRLQPRRDVRVDPKVRRARTRTAAHARIEVAPPVRAQLSRRIAADAHSDPIPRSPPGRSYQRTTWPAAYMTARSQPASFCVRG